MNTLTEMLKAQADFNLLVRTGGPHVTRDERLRQYALALMMESAELMDWLPWKHWSRRSGNKQIHPTDMYSQEHMDEIKVEIIDCLHFILSLALELDMDEEEIYQLYMTKMATNYNRQSKGGY